MASGSFMKLILATFVLGFGPIYDAVGQFPPSPSPPSRREGPPAPPPAPLIYSAPSKSELEVFTPDSKFFSAEFPGSPSERKQTVGEAVTLTYRTYRKGSNSVVAVTETSVRLANRIEEAYQLIREAILKQGGKIEEESEVSVSAWPGREFQVLQNYTYRRFRVFVVNSRVFEIQSDVTNWHIISDKVKAEWHKDTDRFFASLKIN